MKELTKEMVQFTIIPEDEITPVEWVLDSER